MNEENIPTGPIGLKREGDAIFAAMKQHLDDLIASELGDEFAVEWIDRDGEPCASLNGCFLCIPRCVDDVTYAICLHEIGHLLGRHRTSKKTIVRERDAWRFAKARAIHWTSAMEAEMRSSLKWYEDGLAAGTVPVLVPEDLMSHPATE